MRLLNVLATLAFAIGAISGYSQKRDTSNRVNYIFNQPPDTRQRPLNYWVVKPPATGNPSSVAERIIVQFKSQPARKNPSGRIAISSQVEEEHQQFLRDLKKLQNNSGSGRVSINTEILYDYKKAFNGTALVTSKGMSDEIRKLDYVLSVTEDKQVRVSDLESSTIINAPNVWSGMNITGKGIRIGIIDTGVDYNHPDLGGGFGPSFKVVGGYDFVNKDTDPFDDHGHGTHVAGIAAANGAILKGVAPDAKIIAYKVLSADGYGNDSDILAAIERSVDPDQNPNTDDALDVVNMSLGRAADPYEPMSAAVNNAVALGVTYVVAAGNNWEVFSIGTPALAEKAITVGATDFYDNTAMFSSKGPVDKTFAIKPDVSAPGVQINSSFKAGGYEKLDGTSMASPHVAGAVALILEKHPDWTPAQVKAALMGTAKKSYEPVWYQGAGRIDVYEAINSEFIVEPGSFSVGRPGQTASWTKKFKTTIFNKINSTRNFEMRFEGDNIDPSINITITPSVFSIGANSSKEVEVSFTVNTAALPVKNFPDYYSGYIVTSSGSRTVKSPFALVNPQVTTLQFEGSIPLIVIAIGTNQNYFWKAYFPTTPQYELFLPTGEYDLITQYENTRFVVTEGLVTNGNKTITLSESLAKNRVVFKPRDKDGNAISANANEGAMGTAIFSGLNRNIMTYFPYAEDTFYISDQNVYRFDMKVHGKSVSDPDHYYEISAGTENGIHENVIATNDPSKFLELNIANPSAGQNQGLALYMQGMGWTSWNNYPIPVSNPLKLLSNEVSYGSKLDGSYIRLSPAMEESGYSWESGAWKILPDSKINFHDKMLNYIKEITATSFDYKLGKSLVRLNPGTSNIFDSYTQTNRIAIIDIFYKGIFNRNLGERENGRVYYKLSSGNNVIQEGSTANYMQTDVFSEAGVIRFEGQPIPYELVLTYNDYQVGGKFGKAVATMNFDLSHEDKNAPHVSSLSLDVNGVSTDQIESGQTAKLIMRVDDWCEDPLNGNPCFSSGLVNAWLSIRKSGTSEWQRLYLDSLGNEYSTFLPDDLASGYYDLKIEATDLVANHLNYELSPGFLVGESTDPTPYAVVSLIEPTNRTVNAGTNPLFRWSSLPLANYILQISKTPDFADPLIDVQKDTTSHNLAVPLEENVTYYWRVRANYADDSAPWSSVFSFYSSTLHPTVLIAPEQDQQNVDPGNIQFKWRKMDQRWNYTLMVSMNEEFSQVIYQQDFLTDTTHFASISSSVSHLYWKVLTMYSTVDYFFIATSSTGRFSLSEGAVTSIAPENIQTFYNYPNPFNEATKFVITAEKPGDYTLVIFDELGRVVREVNSYAPSAGKHEIQWDGKNSNDEKLASGFYIARIQTPTSVRSIKTVINR